jgi:hypothetical protein
MDLKGILITVALIVVAMIVYDKWVRPRVA